MATASASTRLSDEYNAFLRSVLWLDRGAAPLTVLSALARLDVDPWQAAAQLAELPEPSACSKLASMLANLPGGPGMRQDIDALCARSVRLLPRVKRSRQSFGL
jgi:hypothetical protein